MSRFSNFFAQFLRSVTLGLCALAAPVSGCAPAPELTAPDALVSPFDPTKGEPLWAVAPLRNESGFSAIDTLLVTDALVASVQEVRGISAIPVNRVIATMRTLNLGAVRSPAEARTLADALGVDAIVVGTITAYDPYDPPTLGLTLGLYPSSATQRDPRNADGTLSIRQISASGVDLSSSVSRFELKPTTVVAEHFDGKNHSILMDLQRYASGRMSPGLSAHGYKQYLANMELFTQFCAHMSVRKLLDGQRIVMAQETTALSLTESPAKARPLFQSKIKATGSAAPAATTP